MEVAGSAVGDYQVLTRITVDYKEIKISSSSSVNIVFSCVL